MYYTHDFNARRRRKGNRPEEIFNMVMAKGFPKLMTDIKTQIQGAQGRLSPKNTKNSIHLPHSKSTKPRTDLQSSKEKSNHYLERKIEKKYWTFHRKLCRAEDNREKYFNTERKEDHQSRIIDLMKVSLKVRKKYRLSQSKSEGNHWGCSSLVEQLFGVYKALRQVPDRKGRKKRKKE